MTLSIFYSLGRISKLHYVDKKKRLSINMS